MSEELEALEKIISHENIWNHGMFKEEYQVIEKALKDYERYKPLIENIENGLTDTISVEDLKVLIKRSKALEIIKNKNVDCFWFIQCESVNEYNKSLTLGKGTLTQEEFDLLKEVLVWD